MKLIYLILIPVFCFSQITSWFDDDANTVALWRFEGNGNEVQGRFSNLTEVGTVTYETTAKGTQAALCNTTNRFTEGALGNLSSAGSVEAIFKRGEATSGNFDLLIHFATSNRLYFRYTGATGVFSLSIGDLSNSTVTGATVANDNEYHYAIITWNGSTANLWLDGVKYGNAVAYTGGVNMTAATGIAGYTSSLLQYVDELRLSNSVRSDAEIAAVQAKFAADWNPATDKGFKEHSKFKRFKSLK